LRPPASGRFLAALPTIARVATEFPAGDRALGSAAADSQPSRARLCWFHGIDDVDEWV
jgi:hypothetical protein